MTSRPVAQESDRVATPHGVCGSGQFTRSGWQSRRATLQVIVCAAPLSSVTALFGQVTRNGPAPGASSSCVAELPMLTLPSRAVSLKLSESALTFTAAVPT